MKLKEIKWPSQVLFLTIGLSLAVSFFTEFSLTRTGTIIAVLFVIIFIVVACLFDFFGVAISSASYEEFKKFSKGKRGVVVGIWLIKNNAKLASFCCDIVGDICSILSGSGVATICLKILNGEGGNLSFLLVVVLTSIVSGITVFLKAILKSVAIKNNNRIVLYIGKVLTKKNNV